MGKVSEVIPSPFWLVARLRLRTVFRAVVWRGQPPYPWRVVLSAWTALPLPLPTAPLLPTSLELEKERMERVTRAFSLQVQQRPVMVHREPWIYAGETFLADSPLLQVREHGLLASVPLSWPFALHVVPLLVRRAQALRREVGQVRVQARLLAIHQPPQVVVWIHSHPPPNFPPRQQCTCSWGWWYYYTDRRSLY